MDNNPNLTEPGIKYFLKSTLSQCKSYKEHFYNKIYNLGVLFFFIGILFIILRFRYKGKISTEELEIKRKKEKEYILTKLNQLSYIKNNKIKKNNMLTDLPVWNNHPELSNLKK